MDDETASVVADTAAIGATGTVRFQRRRATNDRHSPSFSPNSREFRALRELSRVPWRLLGEAMRCVQPLRAEFNFIMKI